MPAPEGLDALELKKRGDAALKTNDFEAAYEYYTGALKFTSSSTILLRNRSVACSRLRRHEDALRDAKRCTELDINWPKGWERLGSVLLDFNLPVAAKLAFTQGLKISPKSKDLLQGLRLAEEQEADNKARTGDANGNASDDDDDNSREADNIQVFENGVHQNGVAREGADQIRGGGGRAMSKAMRRELRDFLSRVESGEIDCLKDGTDTSSMSGTDGASDGQPEPQTPEEPSARKEHPARPRAQSGSATSPVSMDAGSNGSWSAGNSHHMANAFAAAAAPLEQGQRGQAAAAERHKDKGNAMYKAGRYQEAIDEYTEALALVPSEQAFYGNRAAAYLMLKKYDQALADCLSALNIDSNFLKAHVRAIKAYVCLGELVAARAQYHKAVAACGGDAVAALKEESAAIDAVGRNLKQAKEEVGKGNHQRALQLAERALELSPACDALKLVQCQAVMGLGRYSDALSMARDLTVGGDPNASEVLVLRGEALYRTNNMAMAQRIFQEALRRDPDGSSAASCRDGLKKVKALLKHKEAGNTAFKAGAWQEAYDEYSAAMAVDAGLRSSFMATLACNRAAACAQLKKHAQAVEDCNLTLELEPGNIKAVLRRAAAYLELEKFEEAVRDYEKVQREEPSTPGIHEMLRGAKLALKKSKRVDYYKVLGLTKDASEADVKRAFRRQALQWHPDKVNGTEEEKSEADRMFKLIGEANSVLGDPVKRRKYDAGMNLDEIDQGVDYGETCTAKGAEAHIRDWLPR
eukprot:jgi/Mesvir1/9277/Mv03137-RA.2